ncbi:MAG: uroporphyrinogen decarboxylase [Betaproteobacteria bacterium]|nr:uroporphyrinogen decarboxylase [Betaproteobacteria bacterium]
MKIDRIETSLHRIPLPVPVEAASHGVMRAFDMVAVQLTDSDSGTGCGYTVLNAGHGAGAAAVIDNAFAAGVLGEDPRRIEWLWNRLWRSHHYSGRGGLVSFAIAAVDTALWDLRGRRLGEPLWRLLGGYRPEVRAYAGNIDLNFPMAKLLDGVRASLAAGYRSIKMRLGRPGLHEDVERVRAVRELVGRDIELMADANEAWRVDQAMRAFRALGEFGLVWIEEPIRPDDFAGYAHLRAHGGVPIAAGENLHTVAEFTALIAAGGVDFPEPDLTTCGGITPWMKIARLAEAHGLPVTSHGAHDLHVHLLAACPNAAYLEVHGFGLGDYMASPLVIRDGMAVAPDRPGHGIEFDWERLAAHRVAGSVTTG